MKQNVLFYSFLILYFIQIIPIFAGKNTENPSKFCVLKKQNIILPKNNSAHVYEKEKALKTNLRISKLLDNIQTDPSPALYQELADIYGYPKYSETIYSDPEDLHGHQQKALILAIQTYEKGITLFPHASELYCGFGKLQFCINHDPAAAITILNKGIEICPSVDLYGALIDVYRYGTKDTKLAIDACKKGLKSYHSLPLYLALGNHLSFLSRSRIDYKYKIKCKKEALEAYQNALNFKKTDTEYKTILQSMLNLYCELADIYPKDVDAYAQELSIYQRKALDTFNIAQQLTDFCIHERIKEKIEAISFLLQENNENQSTIQNLKDTEEIVTENKAADNIPTLNEETEKIDPSHKNKIIWSKFVESIQSNAETIPENSSALPSNENNIIWGDSVEPIDYNNTIYETNLDYISTNSIVETLDPFEIARNYFDWTINTFNAHTQYIYIQTEVTNRIKVCQNI
jgi:tetratricopeptide (TPR) repeat protein